MDALDKIRLGVETGTGGIMGHLWASFLTVIEIVAVSNPDGVAIGALDLVGFVLDAKEKESGKSSAA